MFAGRSVTTGVERLRETRGQLPGVSAFEVKASMDDGSGQVDLSAVFVLAVGRRDVIDTVVDPAFCPSGQVIVRETSVWCPVDWCDQRARSQLLSGWGTGQT